MHLAAVKTSRSAGIFCRRRGASRLERGRGSAGRDRLPTPHLRERFADVAALVGALESRRGFKPRLNVLLTVQPCPDRSFSSTLLVSRFTLVSASSNLLWEKLAG